MVHLCTSGVTTDPQKLDWLMSWSVKIPNITIKSRAIFSNLLCILVLDTFVLRFHQAIWTLVSLASIRETLLLWHADLHRLLLKGNKRSRRISFRISRLLSLTTFQAYLFQFKLISQWSRLCAAINFQVYSLRVVRCLPGVVIILGSSVIRMKALFCASDQQS